MDVENLTESVESSESDKEWAVCIPEIKWTFWDKITMPFWRRCQRFKRGYAWSDVWNMFDWFIDTVKPMLMHLRDHGCGVPFEFVDNEEGWASVLNQMIQCLDLMDEDNAETYVKNNYGDLAFRESMVLIDRVMNENKDKFFELFSKYFYNLWD